MFTIEFNDSFEIHWQGIKKKIRTKESIGKFPALEYELLEGTIWCQQPIYQTIILTIFVNIYDIYIRIVHGSTMNIQVQISHFSANIN